MIVEQTRHRLSTELKEMSQQDIRKGLDDGCWGDGIEQILQIFIFNLSGGQICQIRFSLHAIQTLL
jgi:hypothetical protein